MKKAITLIAAVLFGVLLGQFPLSWPEAIAAPGSQTTYTIILQGDKDFLYDNETGIKKLARVSKRVASLQKQITAWTAVRNRIGDRVRSGLVKHRPGLDSLLPDPIIDGELGHDDSVANGSRDSTENDVVRLWVNADAATNRTSPPAGVVVGP